jgi:hypothetical protein
MIDQSANEEVADSAFHFNIWVAALNSSIRAPGFGQSILSDIEVAICWEGWVAKRLEANCGLIFF